LSVGAYTSYTAYHWHNVH